MITLCYTCYVIQNFGSWVVWALDVSWCSSQDVGQVTVMWKFDWSWWIYFQVGSLTWQAYWCWLLGGGSLSPLFGPFSKVVWVSVIYGKQLLPDITANDPRSQDGSHDVFYEPTLKISYHHFCNILLVALVSPIYCGRGLDKWIHWESS